MLAKPSLRSRKHTEVGSEILKILDKPTVKEKWAHEKAGHYTACSADLVV